VITYEYPLNERIRTLLRLEDLFERADHFVSGEDSRAHHAALITLFEILEVSGARSSSRTCCRNWSGRTGPARVRTTLKSRDGAPGGDFRHRRSSAALFAMPGKIGQHLRENDWLMSIKQRTGIPGGFANSICPRTTSGFTAKAPGAGPTSPPGFPRCCRSGTLPHRAETAARRRQAREARRHRAAFSQMLGGKQSQMVRIRVPRESQFIPEISANRYALNVRFSTFGTRVCEADVEFELTFCNL